jgi:hypothetical protein
MSAAVSPNGVAPDVVASSASAEAAAPAAAADASQQRVAALNDDATALKFGGNAITTGKFTLLSFVPLSLFEQ